MISISTNIYPYRMSLRTKEPVELTFSVKNIGEKNALVSMEVVVDSSLCLNGSGSKKSDGARLGKLGPGESKDFRYMIYPFQGIRPGKHGYSVKVIEHAGDYSDKGQATEKEGIVNVD